MGKKIKGVYIKFTGPVLIGIGWGVFYFVTAFSNPELTSTQVILKMINTFMD
jgi:hypothetical protein